MLSDRSAEQLELELQTVADREIELRKSARQYDKEIWKLSRQKRAIQDQIQHLREEQWKKNIWDEKAIHASEMEQELQAGIVTKTETNIAG